LLRGAFITFGAMALTALVIRASDTWIPPAKELVSGAGNATEKGARCPNDMTFVSSSNGGFCVDRYEASPAKTCPFPDPKNQFETSGNLSDPRCLPASTEGGIPWVNIPLAQAMELCARAGKHLPGNAEWYRASLGTPDRYADETAKNDCVLSQTGAVRADRTGGHSGCISSSGAYDMVGNVWEWVDASVVNGEYEKRALPPEGYVTETDANGVAVATEKAPSELFHNDYFYVKPDGVVAMIRGGFWSLGERAGVNAINATIPTNFVGSAVGFRCAK
jgi:formylglycine-generating enzyme required for sulfatase activity